MSFYQKHFTGIGIDISDHHVRIAQVSFFGSVKKTIEIKLPPGLVEDEKGVQAETLQQLVGDRLEKEGLSHQAIHTTLLVPESRVFASGFTFSTVKGKEQIKHESLDRAQQEIPIPFDQAVMVVSRGRSVAHQVRSTVYAIEQSVFSGLTAVCPPQQVNLAAMEANSKALLRLFQTYGTKKLQVKDPQSLIGLVDIGHAWATISLYTPDGSNMFSRTLAYIREDKAVDSIQLPQVAVDFIHRTIDEVVVYFEQKERRIEFFLFAGVEAEDDRFKKEQHFHQLGNVVHLKGQTKRTIHVFGAAIGAAIRSAHLHRYAYQHNFIHSREA